MQKYFLNTIRQYIFIILTATVILLILQTKIFSQENIFKVEKVKVAGLEDINFSRDKYINRAFSKSFKMLMSKILVSSDLKKIKNVKSNKIKSLINSFQITEEKYEKGEYSAAFTIVYNEKKLTKLLANKNISFSQPRKISSVIFPILFIEDQLQNFNENFFYNKWLEIEIENEIIEFILPLEDLDDLEKIQKMKNRIEDFDISDVIKKYNENNYVFLFMDYKNKKLNTYLKTSFENNVISKNISYEIDNIKNISKLNFIIKDLKIKITDLWKEINFVNLLMPLSITIKFKHKNINDLDKLKNTLNKINLIDNYNIQKFNIDHSFFEIYYFGNPKRLSSELYKFGYELKNNQGHWELFAND